MLVNNLSNLEKWENILQNITFVTLFLTTIFYWGYTAFSSFTLSNKAQKQLIDRQAVKKNNLDSVLGTVRGGLAQQLAKSIDFSLPYIFMVISNLLLILLLLVRWKISGHFPLSNLYESLMFLAWCCTFLFLLYQTSLTFNVSNTVPVFIKSPSTLIQGLEVNTNLPTEGLRPQYDTTQGFAHASHTGMEGPQEATSHNFWDKSCDPQHNNLSSAGNNAVNTSVQPNVISLEKIVGSIIASSALLMNAFATFSLPKEMQLAAPLVPALQSNWLMMHVTVMIISYATLIIGSLLSILFLILNKFINLPQFAKQDQPTTVYTKLEVTINYLDIFSYRIIGLGFPFLTIGILSGAVWANEAWGSYWSWDPKETWALLTWLVFAIYLHTRLTKGWQGEKPAFIASLGFLVVWFCYLGVNLLGEGLHSYGFFH